jgi:hypothetical protein
MPESREPASTRPAPETVAASLQASAQLYASMGVHLYSALCRAAAGDAELVALAGHGQASARAMHLLSAVHYLLLEDPDDPLGRFFATLTPDPAPPEAAFPELQRFCREHRCAILALMASRTVQTTFVERCRAMVAPFSLVADQAGEPLNVVEIGCSAGVLLTFDRYAYEFAGRGRLGAPDAPLTLAGELHGGPALRIPTLGTRTGIDLHPIDAHSEDQRRWLLALCFPEYREQQARLAIALEEVARADIRMLQGDALDLLPGVLDETASPLCVFHSACLFYWSAEAREALDRVLARASRGREIWRVGIEPDEGWNAWNRGCAADARATGPVGGVTVWRYRDGAALSRFVAHNSADYGALQWVGPADAL